MAVRIVAKERCMSKSDSRRIAVLGAGPIGLESALYARRLGFAVTVYERGQVADAVRRLGHVRPVQPVWLEFDAIRSGDSG